MRTPVSKPVETERGEAPGVHSDGSTSRDPVWRLVWVDVSGDYGLMHTVKMEWQITGATPNVAPQHLPPSLLNCVRSWLDTPPEPPVTVHCCPLPGSGVMPCCGLPPGERLADRMTVNVGEVTCRG